MSLFLLGVKQNSESQVTFSCHASLASLNLQFSSLWGPDSFILWAVLQLIFLITVLTASHWASLREQHRGAAMLFQGTPCQLMMMVFCHLNAGDVHHNHWYRGVSVVPMVTEKYFRESIWDYFHVLDFIKPAPKHLLLWPLASGAKWQFSYFCYFNYNS